MTLQLVRLKLQTPFHVGERGVGLEGATAAIQADTLFGAICHAWRRLFGLHDSKYGIGLQNWLNSFPRLMMGKEAVEGGESANYFEGEGEPPLCLSSLFPYVRLVDGSSVYTLPLPLGFDYEGDVKKLKKIAYASFGQFRPAAASWPLLNVSDPATIQDGTIWLSAEERSNLPPSTSEAEQLGGNQRSLPLWQLDKQEVRRSLYDNTAVPHVTIDRQTTAPALYHVGSVRYAEQTGLYFIAEVANDTLVQFQQAVRLVGDTGLGGRRTSGHGLFTPTFFGAEGKADRGRRPKPTDPVVVEQDGNAALLLKLVEAGQRGDGGRWLNLGLVAPRSAMELGDLLKDITTDRPPAYRLLQRRGWVDSDSGEMSVLRSRAVTLFSPGSVLASRPQGALVEVRPQGIKPGDAGYHPVYRFGCGLSFAL